MNIKAGMLKLDRFDRDDYAGIIWFLFGVTYWIGIQTISLLKALHLSTIIIARGVGMFHFNKDVQERLTQREVDVLERYIRLPSQQAVAESLGLALVTVKRHLQTVREKLGVPHNLAAVVYAIKNDFIKLSNFD